MPERSPSPPARPPEGARRLRAGALRVAAMALALGALAAAPAIAQTLDLGPREPAPAPNTGVAAQQLAAALEQRIRADRSAAQRDARVHAASGLRALARAMLLKGEDLGEAGSIHVLAGRTLAARLPGIEAYFAMRAADDAALRLLGDEAAAAVVPADVGAVDRLLRDLLAIVLQDAGDAGPEAGWIEAPCVAPPPRPDAFEAAVARWADAPGVDDAASALTELSRLLAEADGWPAYRRSAERARSLLMRASRPFDPESAAARAIDEQARMPYALRFGAAAGRLLEATTRDEALADLRALAEAGDVLAALAELRPRPGQGRRHATVIASVAQALAAPGDPSESAARLALLRRVAGLLHDAENPEPESVLIRQLRPAHRALTTAARRHAADLFDALPRLAQDPSAATDPGAISAIAAQQAYADDLRLLARLSQALAQPPGAGPPRQPVLREGHERLAARLLAFGQQMNDPSTAEAARGALRTFAASYVRLHRLPGEPAPGSPAPEPGAPTDAPIADARHDELLGAVRDTRAAWLDAWIDQRDLDAAQHAARLEQLATAMGLIDAAARARDERAMAALNAWPGWELSPEALDAMARALESDLPAAMAAALDADAVAAARVLEPMAHRHAALRLTVRLARLAGDRGLGPPTRPVAGLHELGTGGPSPAGSWLAAQRATLARVCRYAEEWAVAARLPEPGPAARLGAFLSRAASEALGSLPPD